MGGGNDGRGAAESNGSKISIQIIAGPNCVPMAHSTSRMHIL